MTRASWTRLACVVGLAWMGAVGATTGCSGNVAGVAPLHGGKSPGEGVACGEFGACACQDFGGRGFCGVCPGRAPDECMYCPYGSVCPADPCSGECGPDRQFAQVDCPASAPISCLGPFCCPSDHPACCPDATCGEDFTDCE